MNNSYTQVLKEIMTINGTEIESTTWTSEDEKAPRICLAIKEDHFNFQILLTAQQARQLATNLMESAQRYDWMQAAAGKGVS